MSLDAFRRRPFTVCGLPLSEILLSRKTIRLLDMAQIARFSNQQAQRGPRDDFPVGRQAWRYNTTGKIVLPFGHEKKIGECEDLAVLLGGPVRSPDALLWGPQGRPQSDA